MTMELLAGTVIVIDDVIASGAVQFGGLPYILGVERVKADVDVFQYLDDVGLLNYVKNISMRLGIQFQRIPIVFNPKCQANVNDSIQLIVFYGKMKRENVSKGEVNDVSLIAQINTVLSEKQGSVITAENISHILDHGSIECKYFINVIQNLCTQYKVNNRLDPNVDVKFFYPIKPVSQPCVSVTESKNWTELPEAPPESSDAALDPIDDKSVVKKPQRKKRTVMTTAKKKL